MKFYKLEKTLLLASITAILSACGGGSSSNDSTVSSQPSPPPSESKPTNSAKFNKASLISHSTDFTWERGEAIKVSLTDQDNQPVAIKSCASDDTVKLTVANDCSNLMIHRLGRASITVTGMNDLTTKINLRGIPPQTPLATHSTGFNLNVKMVTADNKVLSWGGDPFVLKYPTMVTNSDGTVLDNIYQAINGGGESDYSYYLDVNGDVWKQGYIDHNDLFSTNYTLTRYPVKNVFANAKFIKIVGGDTTAVIMGITDDKKAMIWNSASIGSNPIVITDESGNPITNIQDIALNSTEGYVVDGEGIIHVISVGEGGYKKGSAISTIKITDYKKNVLKNVVKVVTSGNSLRTQHSLALTKDGKVYNWGNKYLTGDSVALSYSVDGAVPVLINKSEALNAKDIAINLGSSYILTNNNNIYSWGYNDNGELGQGDNAQGYNEPKAVVNTDGTGMLSNIATLTTYDAGAIAIKQDGSIVGWGSNQYGALTQPNLRTSSGYNYRKPVALFSSNGQPLKIDLTKYTQIN